MPSEIEVRVMRLLSAVELPPGAAPRIERMGTEAVTVVCEAALGTYVGQRAAIRHHAAALVGRMAHVQAVETLALLLESDDPGVARRALRAVRRRDRRDLVPHVQALLDRDDTPPGLAAEAVLTLAAVDSDPARAALAAYRGRDAAAPPHRRAPVVRRALERTAAAPR
jgi:hypothetical protein